MNEDFVKKSMDDITKGLRSVLTHFIGEPVTPEMKRDIAERLAAATRKISMAGSSFIRERLRELSFMRAILPARPRISARRVIVAERSDGRTCWLSVGKKQVLSIGPSGWVSLPVNIRHHTVCDEFPLVFRPVADDAPVTCLTCMLAGRPRLG